MEMGDGHPQLLKMRRASGTEEIQCLHDVKITVSEEWQTALSVA